MDHVSSDDAALARRCLRGDASAVRSLVDRFQADVFGLCFRLLDREIARSSRYDRPLSLVMLDIDKFRAINEELGHLGGDFTLREISARIKGNIRKEELFARYGGEEFAVVLPETHREGATLLAERLIRVVNQRPFEYEQKQYAVTVSAGVATTTGEKSITSVELIRRADEKLYQAKNAGRNRVVS